MRSILLTCLGALMLHFGSYAQLDGRGIAPDFILRDVDDVEQHLYDYLDAGKVVVLDFFAVWCSICQADASYLRTVYLQYGPLGSGKIEMLSLEADDATSDTQAKNYALNFQAENPHINATGAVPAQYSVQFFPSYYVIAPDRSYQVIGGRQETMQSEMIAAIESAPGLRTVENDVRLRSFTRPVESICASSFEPELRIQNYGKNTISSCDIQTWIDGELIARYPWNGVLPPYALADLVLPEINGVASGWHRLEFRFDAVNGQPDGDPDNGGGGDFLILPEGTQIQVEVLTDAYPRETSWSVYQNGRQVIHKSGYTKGLTRDTTSFCVEDGACYRLVVYDEYGDGMSSGGLQVLYGEEQLAEIQSFAFGADSIWVDFCVSQGSTGTQQAAIQQSEITVYPNPSSGKIWLQITGLRERPSELTVLNITGAVVWSGILPQHQNNMQIDLSDSPGGLYFVRLKTASGIQTQRILVSH